MSVLLLLGVACGGDSVAGLDEGGVVPVGPVSIEPRADGSRAAAAVIGTGGGTIEAVGEDGTRLRLVIPPNAVSVPTKITVTPVTALAGLPMSHGFVGAAEFAPEGLRLAEAATLTITPARAFDGREVVGFGYHEGAAGFHLRPSTLAGGSVTLRIAHFSGDGVGLATRGEVVALGAMKPSSAEDALDQDVAVVADAARRSGSELPDAGSLTELFRRYYRDELRGLLIAGAERAPYDTAAASFYRARLWEHEEQLYGLRDAFAAEEAEIASLWDAATRRLFAEAATACITGHKLELIPRLISIERGRELLGAAALPLDESLRRCSTFTLDYSIATDVTGATEQHTLIAGSIPLLIPAVLSAPLTGSAVPTTATWRMQVNNVPAGCTMGSTGTNAPPPVRVVSMRLVLPDSGKPVSDVRLAFDPQLGWTGTSAMTCGTTTTPLGAVPIAWLTLSPLAIEPSGWEMLRGEVYARLVRDVTLSNESGASTSHLTLTLRHTPGA